MLTIFFKSLDFGLHVFWSERVENGHEKLRYDILAGIYKWTSIFLSFCLAFWERDSGSGGAGVVS